MASFQRKYIGKSSKYKNVYSYKLGPKTIYYAEACRDGVKWKKDNFELEIDAARAVDRRLISLGEEPINVFKRKV
jgi:hypothetical protein